MINEKVNKRIAVTLPIVLLSRLNRFCVDNSYVRISDVVRIALEEFLKDEV